MPVTCKQGPGDEEGAHKLRCHGSAPCYMLGIWVGNKLNKTGLGYRAEIFGGLESCSFDTEFLLQGVDWLPRALTAILSCFRKHSML